MPIPYTGASTAGPPARPGALRVADTPRLPRAADEVLSELLRLFPVVVVSGARRTGKSTLVRSHPLTSRWSYRSLDDVAERARAEHEPAAFADAGVPTVIDEVQRAPSLVLAIKAVVDRPLQPSPGQFVLTGSSDLLSDPRAGDSLAGRAGYMRLGPLTLQERLGRPAAGRWTDLLDTPVEEWPALLRATPDDPEDWRVVAQVGGLPEVVRATSDSDRARLLDSYVATYLERDLRDRAEIDQLYDFQRVMRAAALRTGNLVNIADLARDVGIAPTTALRWLNLLEAGFLLVRLPAWARNRTSRLIKASKIFWADSGLCLRLADEPEPRGAHLENVVLADLLVWRELRAPRPGVYHWRAASGREVDFVVERMSRVLAVEVKTTRRPVPADWKNLRAFVDEYPDVCHGALLLHTGDETFRAADRVVAAPWWRVL